MSNPFAGVRWLWMLLGGVIAEVVLFAIAAGVYAAGPANVDAVLNLVTPPACLVATFLVALWIVRRAKANYVMNGVALGLVAALLYVPLFFVMETIPVSYLVAEALKILGGAAGGWWVGRGRQPAAA